MKKSQYEHFKSEVKNAPLDNTAPIWFAGYLWITLNDKQVDEITRILIDRGCPIYKGARGFEVRTPAGFGLLLDLSI